MADAAAVKKTLAEAVGSPSSGPVAEVLGDLAEAIVREYDLTVRKPAPKVETRVVKAEEKR